MTQTEQAACPEWARYISHESQQPVDYSNTPPGDGQGWRVIDMEAGDEAWIISYGVFRDDRGHLWVDGKVSSGHNEGESGTVHVIRTEDGIRVLTWLHRATIKEQRPNRYSDQRDIWVVEFPTDPIDASCLICARNRPRSEMRYDPFESEKGIEDAWTCGDDPECIPWITNTDLGRSWMRGRA